MTTLREAAQQALEALEFSTLDAFMLAPISPGRESTIKAITALRAALAEPVQEPEPGAYHGWVLREVLFDNGEPVGHREPVQEPVAWRITDGEGDWEYRTDLPEDWSIQWSARYGRRYEPLYTSPPQRKPLSADETMSILNETAGHHWCDEAHLQRFRAAIERAHGIGGEA